MERSGTLWNARRDDPPNVAPVLVLPAFYRCLLAAHTDLIIILLIRVDDPPGPPKILEFYGGGRGGAHYSPVGRHCTQLLRSRVALPGYNEPVPPSRTEARNVERI